MSQGENPTQNHRMKSWQTGIHGGNEGVLALEGESLPGSEGLGMVCHSAISRSLGGLSWERAGWRLSKITWRDVFESLCILPRIKRRKFVY